MLYTPSSIFTVNIIIWTMKTSMHKLLYVIDS